MFGPVVLRVDDAGEVLNVRGAGIRREIEGSANAGARKTGTLVARARVGMPSAQNIATSENAGAAKSEETRDDDVESVARIKRSAWPKTQLIRQKLGKSSPYAEVLPDT